MPKLYKIMFSISGVLAVGSLILFLIFGLNLGIDFTGGSLLEVEFLNERPQNQQIRDVLDEFDFGQVSVSPAGDKGLIIKMPEISEQTHQEILNELGRLGSFEEKRFDSIGSSLGKELKEKSITAVALALVLISLYLAFMFRKIGGVISPWILALGAIVGLLHDLLLPVGVFSLLGRLKGIQIDAPFIAAALAILGYSINDTVVVYDRIRENILKKQMIKDGQPSGFKEIVHRSIKQTLARSINTTLTTLFAITAIYIFGGPTLKNFSLALIIGIASGAYSSIFVASPILMFLHRS